MTIKTFAIFKNDKATGNQPQYRMVVRKAEGEKSVEAAGVWLKEANGTKYYSGQMKDEFTKDDGTKYDGFVIITQAEYDQLKALAQGGAPKNDAPAEEDIDQQVPF